MHTNTYKRKYTEEEQNRYARINTILYTHALLHHSLIFTLTLIKFNWFVYQEYRTLTSDAVCKTVYMYAPVCVSKVHFKRV